MDMREAEERRVLLWNPTDRPVRTSVSAYWPDGRISRTDVQVEPRTVQSLTMIPAYIHP